MVGKWQEYPLLVIDGPYRGWVGYCIASIGNGYSEVRLMDSEGHPQVILISNEYLLNLEERIRDDKN